MFLVLARMYAMLKIIDIGKTLPAKSPTVHEIENVYTLRYAGICQRVINSELRSIAGKALTRLEGCWGISLSSMYPLAVASSKTATGKNE